MAIWSKLLLILATSLIPVAQAAVSVDSLNYPAWVERGAGSSPLAPGTLLAEGDTIRTGASGRVWLAIDDGSVVKIGSNARFAIDRARFEGAGDSSVFDAAFDVLVGAFRFTSSFFTAKRAAAHRVDIRVGAITAGIRGTDIWGRAAADEDFVALLEGSIEVGAAGETPVLMQQPLSLYAKKRGQPASGVGSVDAATVQQLAPETELDADAGIANTVGGFALVLMSLRSAELAQANLQRFRDAGYPVDARAVELDGGAFTRLRLDGLADRRAAENLRARLAREFSIADIWITRQP